MNLLLYHCKGNAIKSFTQICLVTKSCYLDFLALLHLSFPFLPTFSPVSGWDGAPAFLPRNGILAKSPQSLAAPRSSSQRALPTRSPRGLSPPSHLPLVPLRLHPVSLPFPSWPLSSLPSPSRSPPVSLPSCSPQYIAAPLLLSRYI